jgi:hypothetical protein
LSFSCDARRFRLVGLSDRSSWLDDALDICNCCDGGVIWVLLAQFGVGIMLSSGEKKAFVGTCAEVAKAGGSIVSVFVSVATVREEPTVKLGGFPIRVWEGIICL